MTIVALVLAGIAAALHVFIWSMESLTWRQPGTWRRFGVESQEQADIVAPMAYNQGFYNLFLAAGAAVGIVLVAVDRPSEGWTLVFFACGSMLAAALVLVSSGRRYLSAALVQGMSPAAAVLIGIISIA